MTRLTSRIGGAIYRARAATDSDPVSDLHRQVGAWLVEAAAPPGGPVVIAGWIIPGRTARETGFRAGPVGCYLGGAPDGPQLMFLGAAGSPRQAVRRIAEAYDLWHRGAPHEMAQLGRSAQQNADTVAKTVYACTVPSKTRCRCTKGMWSRSTTTHQDPTPQRSSSGLSAS